MIIYHINYNSQDFLYLGYNFLQILLKVMLKFKFIA